MPAQFELEVVSTINPAANKALEGLFVSSGNFCTQCEAEGFRRITFFLDRPDNLAVYTTRIEADKTAYPILLSNGNPNVEPTTVAIAKFTAGPHVPVNTQTMAAGPTVLLPCRRPQLRSRRPTASTSNLSPARVT